MAFIRSLLAVLVMLSTASLSVSIARAQLKTEIQINITEIIKEIASWIKDYAARSDRIEQDRIKNSKSLLIKQLLDLSAAKSQAAKQLRIFSTTPSDNSNQLQSLRDSLNRISRKIQLIMSTIRKIDPVWVEGHRSMFSKASELAYHKQSLFYGSIELQGEDEKSRERAGALAATFEQEAQSVSQIANEL